MIAALFALAAAMVIGGCAAVVQGFPYVRLESGLVMVIAGAVTASSGAVLFGLGVVAAGLRRVERAFGARSGVETVTARQDGIGPEPLPASPVPHPGPSPVDPIPAPVRPTLPGAAAGALDGLASADRPPAGRPHAEPTFEDALFEPTLSEPAAQEPELPIPGLTPPGPVEPPPEPPGRSDDLIAPEDDLFASPEALPAIGAPTIPGEPAEDGPALRPALDAAQDAEPDRRHAEAVASDPKREVVGRHSSGGNTYVMFADGSIEAETPQGRFTFESLDELKAFVNAGGEAGARGAA